VVNRKTGASSQMGGERPAPDGLTGPPGGRQETPHAAPNGSAISALTPPQAPGVMG